MQGLVAFKQHANEMHNEVIPREPAMQSGTGSMTELLTIGTAGWMLTSMEGKVAADSKPIRQETEESKIMNILIKMNRLHKNADVTFMQKITICAEIKLIKLKACKGIKTRLRGQIITRRITGTTITGVRGSNGRTTGPHIMSLSIEESLSTQKTDAMVIKSKIVNMKGITGVTTITAVSMQTGKPAKTSTATHILPTDLPKPTKTNLSTLEAQDTNLLTETGFTRLKNTTKEDITMMSFQPWTIQTTTISMVSRKDLKSPKIDSVLLLNFIKATLPLQTSKKI